MSKLKELIEELCPDGVEYKRLADVTTIARGVRVVRSQLAETGKFPVYQNSMKPLGYYEKANCPAKTTFVIGAGAAGEVGYCDVDFWAADDCYYFEYSDEINSRYLFHVLLSRKQQLLSQVRKASVPRLARTVIEALVIPVPPLEVQREIVHILDTYTNLTTELTAKLTDELTARKKQYEYYRDKLLTFDALGGVSLSKIRWKILGEIFEFRNGLSKGKEFFGHGIPFVRYTDVYNHRSLRKKDIIALVECTPSEVQKLRVSRGDVLFTRTSETAEDVGWSSVMLDDIGDCVFNGFTIKATPKTDDLLPEYCAYCFATDDFRNYVSTHCAFTTRASLTGNTIAEYQMAIPSIDVQREIANILANFDTICSDLSIGLLAEIEARQKQYEYYREKLLTFKEPGK